MQRRAILSMGVAAGALAAPGLLSATAFGPEPVDVELALAVDVSRSVAPEQVARQFHGYAAAFRDPLLAGSIAGGPIGAIAVTLFTWAGPREQSVVVPWRRLDCPAACERLADALAAPPRQTRSLTSISAAMDFAAKQFGRGFEGTRRVMAVSGGGINNAGRAVPLARRAALDQGIVINGLAVLGRGAPSLEAYYRDEVIGGPGAFLVVAEGSDAFEAALRRKVLREIAAAPPPGPRIERCASVRTKRMEV